MAPIRGTRDGAGPRRAGDGWGEDAYLLLLLEFQSTSGHFMALRVLAYAALLWQQLIAERRIHPDWTLPARAAGHARSDPLSGRLAILALAARFARSTG